MSELIARVMANRRSLAWLGVIVIAVVCVVVLITRIEIDSDVINMLPKGFQSVEGLKIFDRDFEQTRELTFALRCQPQDIDKLEEFAPQFAENLRKQAWCERVLAGSPMETPEGVRDLQTIAVPLLLNLDPAAFDQTISILQPQRIRERLHRLRLEIEAGSPRPQFELGLDPLGVIGPALKPFAEANAIEQEQPLASPDRTMRIFLVVTNQSSLSAFECQRLMRQVNAFRSQARVGWDGGHLDVLVTGRSAYVSEISLSMRHDIVATLGSSVLLVGLVFFIGFRRWLPLFGMGFALLLSCLVALSAGLLVFGRLSMVAVGFCAILVGLGVDFAILIFGRYQQARIDGEEYQHAIATSVAKLGRAVFFGALTTAVGFLALVLSGSMGFSQLGVLIAIGIFFAGLFMCTILFLFVKPGQVPQQHDWVFEVVKKYVRWSVERPGPALIFSGTLFVVLSVVGFSPVPPLRFEASVRSLEPRNSRASQALQAIMREMPTRWEPVLGIVRARDAQELHDNWQKISAHWFELQRAGKLKGFSTPAALCLSPDWMEKNRESLGKVDFQAARETLEQTLDVEGFSRDSFSSAFKLIDDLQAVAKPGAPLPDWRKQLPKGAGWWFLVDRYFATDPLLTAGFATTNEPVTSHAQSDELGRELPVAGVPIILSGWSYALADLQPWSRHQLLIISALMAIFDVSLLAILYRDFRLWLIQVITLAFGIGAMIATMKLLNIHLNLLNVLSFRLVLAIGVDYGIYVVLVWQKTRELEHDVAGVIKPVILAGLTAVSGFGSLGWAHNPSLSGLGIACAIGIFWSLVATIFFTLPAMAAAKPKIWNETPPSQPI
ncbi:MAG TPA: MMPL family transporter [Chthoniobacterales bacterium]|nr:MMPL family transporter [Chthoniobacterales bacterium]